MLGLNFLKSVIEAAACNIVLVHGAKGAERGNLILAKYFANLAAGDAQKAQEILTSVGIQSPTMPELPAIIMPTAPAVSAPLPAPAPQVTPPAIQQAPPIAINGPDANNRPMQHAGPGRPRKEGGRP
jgi:hypothetical protein